MLISLSQDWPKCSCECLIIKGIGPTAGPIFKPGPANVVINVPFDFAWEHFNPKFLDLSKVPPMQALRCNACGGPTGGARGLEAPGVARAHPQSVCRMFISEFGQLISYSHIP